VFDEHVGDILFADLQVKGEGAVEVAREELHAGGFDRSDDQAGLLGGGLAEFPEGCCAGLLDLGVRRKVFEGENVVSWEAEDGFRGEGSGEFAGGEDGCVERLGGFVVGDDDDTRGVGCADEEGKVESACGEGESGHTTAPRASAEVAANTLEGFGVLQVREELANEGKNHAVLILEEVRCHRLWD
jgi:hypothetical protein